MAVPDSDDAGPVERGLDATRARLSSHLDQLRDRMTPGQVLDDVVGYFRGKEGAEFGRSLISSVKRNPLPTAVTGIGLAWLMATNGRAAIGPSAPTTEERGMGSDATSERFLRQRAELEAAKARMRLADQSVSRQDGESEHAYVRRREDAVGFAIGEVRQPEDTNESFTSRIQAALADGLQGAKDGLGGAASSAGTSLRNSTASIRSAVSDTVDRAGTAVSAGGQSAGQTGGRWVAAFAESPALMGALSLAAGALLGALLPQSDTEEAVLGGVAGAVRTKATALAHDGMDKGSAIASSVVDAGSSSLQTHGLAGEKTAGQLVDAAISGDLASDAKQVVFDVMQAGDDAVRHNLPELPQPSSSPKPTS